MGLSYFKRQLGNWPLSARQSGAWSLASGLYNYTLLSFIHQQTRLLRIRPSLPSGVQRQEPRIVGCRVRNTRWGNDLPACTTVCFCGWGKLEDCLCSSLTGRPNPADGDYFFFPFLVTPVQLPCTAGLGEPLSLFRHSSLEALHRTDGGLQERDHSTGSSLFLVAGP